MRWGRPRRRPPGPPPCEGERAAPSGCRAPGLSRRAATPCPRGTGPAGLPAGSHHVFSQAAQTHLQVLPSAAASGNERPFVSISRPLRSSPPCPAPGRGLGPGAAARRGAGPAGRPGLCPRLLPARLRVTGPGGGGVNPRRRDGGGLLAAPPGNAPPRRGTKAAGPVRGAASGRACAGRRGALAGGRSSYRGELLYRLKTAHARLLWKVLSNASGVRALRGVTRVRAAGAPGREQLRVAGGELSPGLDSV